MSWENPDISHASSAGGGVPDSIRLLAEKVKRVHGAVHLAHDCLGCCMLRPIPDSGKLGVAEQHAQPQAG